MASAQCNPDQFHSQAEVKYHILEYIIYSFVLVDMILLKNK